MDSTSSDTCKESLFDLKDKGNHRNKTEPFWYDAYSYI